MQFSFSFSFSFIFSDFWLFGGWGGFVCQRIRKITKQKQAVYLHHFSQMAVSSVIIFLPTNLSLANARNRILTSIIHRWTFDPVTYSSFCVLSVAMHFEVTTVPFRVTGTPILRNWHVMVTTVLGVNMQSYSKGQVVFKILVKNFKQNQMIIHASKKKKSFLKPIILHKYLITLHRNKSTGMEIKTYVYSG